MTNSFGGLSVQKPQPPSKGGIRDRSSPKNAIEKAEARAKKMRSAKKSSLLASKRSRLPGPNPSGTDTDMLPTAIFTAIEATSVQGAPGNDVK